MVTKLTDSEYLKIKELLKDILLERKEELNQNEYLSDIKVRVSLDSVNEFLIWIKVEDKCIFDGEFSKVSYLLKLNRETLQILNKNHDVKLYFNSERKMG